MPALSNEESRAQYFFSFFLSFHLALLTHFGHSQLFSSSDSTFDRSDLLCSTTAMVKKPPCRICRSRRWRKNSNGFFICELGHQLEVTQARNSSCSPELILTQAMTLYSMKKQCKCRRVSKKKCLSSIPRWDQHTRE